MIHKGDFSLAHRNPNDKIVHHTLKGSCSGLLDASQHPGWSGQMVVLSKWKSRCRGVDNEDMLHNSQSSDWGNTYSWQKKANRKNLSDNERLGSGSGRFQIIRSSLPVEKWFVIRDPSQRRQKSRAQCRFRVREQFYISTAICDLGTQKQHHYR